jgi:hypothetical protein
LRAEIIVPRSSIKQASVECMDKQAEKSSFVRFLIAIAILKPAQIVNYFPNNFIASHFAHFRQGRRVACNARGELLNR